MRIVQGLLAISLLLAGSSAIWADRIYMRNGAQIDGVIINQNKNYTIHGQFLTGDCFSPISTYVMRSVYRLRARRKFRELSDSIGFRRLPDSQCSSGLLWSGPR
ncbi:MAG: hypothetical protein JNM27_13530 [Leptospirales bacterium]|nr:hypothetical protein [Leptospirales bacterium]